MSGFHPLQNNQGEASLTVPSTYRAWAYWCSTQGFGGMQVRDIQSAYPCAGGTGLETDGVTLTPWMTSLCEVYARAIMEVAIGLHFSAADTRTDMLVLEHVEQLFSASVAALVRQNVAARGPVPRRLDASPFV